MHPTVSFSLLQLMKRSIPAMEIHMPGKIKERGSPLFDRWKNKLPYLTTLINCPISLMGILLHWHQSFNTWFLFSEHLPLEAFVYGLNGISPPEGSFNATMWQHYHLHHRHEELFGLVIVACASGWFPFPFFPVGPPDRICLKFHAKLV